MYYPHVWPLDRFVVRVCGGASAGNVLKFGWLSSFADIPHVILSWQAKQRKTTIFAIFFFFFVILPHEKKNIFHIIWIRDYEFHHTHTQTHTRAHTKYTPNNKRVRSSKASLKIEFRFDYRFGALLIQCYCTVYFCFDSDPHDDDDDDFCCILFQYLFLLQICLIIFTIQYII